MSSDANVKRMDRLLWQGRYWPARRMLWRVGKDFRALGFARLQLRFRRGNVDKAIERVPAHLKDNLGLAYERLRWRRKNENINQPLNFWMRSQSACLNQYRTLKNGGVNEPF